MTKIWLLIICSAMLVACQKSDGPTLTDTAWIKHETPVLTRGDYPGYDFYAISDCWVLREGETYKMWYTSAGAVINKAFKARIGYATSKDGVHWEKFAGNPVMDVSAGLWDSAGVETVTVIIDEKADPAQRYKMWYAGQTFNAYRYEIGYAWSPDGIHWTKQQGGAVLKVGSSGEWDNAFLEGPSVLKEGDGYKMWYAGFDLSIDGKPTDGKVNIGLATSTDGIHWTKFAGNPVMTTGTGWDAETVQDPHVIKGENGYHMWFGGVDKVDVNGQEIGYAFSADGIHWGKSAANPIVKSGAAGSWDGFIASFPSVLIEENEVKMWYTGKSQLTPPWPEPYNWDIGFVRKDNGAGVLNRFR